jgi:predicted ATP-grasp superfamily ATP-dependent carboligase
MKVLVTDAEHKSALAAIRSLGRHGAHVVAGSERRLARGFVSAYSAERLRYPPPEHEEEFVAFLIDAARHRGLDVVLPVGDAANRVLAKHRERVVPHVALPVASWPAMRIASSKQLTLPFAEALGVGVPRDYPTAADVDTFPVVVKRSSGAGWVRYANDRAELQAIDVDGAVIQEWIPGDGYGFFALFEGGRERAVFMHRRIREYPATGGASTAAESIEDPELEELGLRLLGALDWHGLAMVEFKKDRRDGRFKLMEINPKLWGSLDLSIAAGVDFPWLAVQMARGGLDGAPPPPYRSGVRFRWVFDDVLHLAARPSSLRAFLGDFRDPAVQQDLPADDVRPALFDAAKTAVVLARRGAGGTLRHPHGQPRGPAASLTA